MNQEFGWDQSNLFVVHPNVGPAPQITIDMECDSVKKIKSGKTAGPSGFVSEMVIAGGEECMKVIGDLMDKYQKIGRRAVFSIFIKKKVLHCAEGLIEVSSLKML